jgi:hypothetical protein
MVDDHFEAVHDKTPPKPFQVVRLEGWLRLGAFSFFSSEVKKKLFCLIHPSDAK